MIVSKCPTGGEDFYNVKFDSILCKKVVSSDIPKEKLKYEPPVEEHGIRARYQRGLKFEGEWLNLFYYNISPADFGTEIKAEANVQKKTITSVKGGIKTISVYTVVNIYKILTKDEVKFKMSFPQSSTIEKKNSDDCCFESILGTDHFVLFQRVHKKTG